MAHDLRHVHGTTLLLAGVPVYVVAERLGHADPSITLRVYAHVVRHHAAEVADSSPAPSKGMRTTPTDQIFSGRHGALLAGALAN
jgi:site-specific recombinase XerC